MTGFTITFQGSIEAGQFPLYDDLYCKFAVVSGQDWSLISGTDEGITQQSRKQPLTSNPINVWNFPLDLAYRSTNAFGWPQIVVSVYGPDMFGRDVVRGYGVAHLPRTPGSHTLYIPMFAPVATSPMNALLSFIAGKLPEFVDAKFVSKSDGREVTRVRSHGCVKLIVHVVAKDMERFGFKV